MRARPRPESEQPLAVRDGEVVRLFSTVDWRSSDVGPPARWSRSLRGYVSMILEMPTPAILFWGPHQTQLYNDGYAVIMGPRHPKYLGARYRDCWPDTYPIIHPWMQRVLQGEVVQVTDQLFVLTRHGFPEEAYFTFTFSPLRDDDGSIAGIFQPVVEVTDAVLAGRRAEMLRRLARPSTGSASSLESAREILAAGSRDLPFGLLFLEAERPGPATNELPLALCTGFEAFEAARPDGRTLSRAVAIAQRVLASGAPVLLEDLERDLELRHTGPWPETTRNAYVVPVGSLGGVRGAAVFGISPRLRFDDRYREFLESVGRQIASGLGAERARRFEESLVARANAARREAELQKENLVSLLTQAPNPMVVLRGADMVIELANPAACNVWMRPHADVIDRPILEALPELRGQTFELLLKSVYETGVAYVGRETQARLVGPDGREELVWFTFVYAPLRRQDGAVDGILVVAFDVSEQVKAREQMDALRHLAETANRAKDEFFAVLGHELRNPLAPILTAVQLMRVRKVPEIEKEREIIERQARHLVRLVDDLLDISRITRGKVELRKEPTELCDALMRAVEMAGPLIEQKRHTLEFRVPPEGLAVEADPSRLAQAFANLLTNAAKFTPSGGHIRVDASRESDQVRVRVKDDGIGIDREMLGRVFEAFAQGPQPIDRSHGGLGLGLAIVRGIIGLHGGEVTAKSEGMGRGSEFEVRLPAAVGSARRLAVHPVSGQTPLEQRAAGCRLLLVDDNQDAATSMASWLRSSGHRVHVAHDGPTALRIAREHDVEAAILDIGLPVMDGYELAQHLRKIQGLERLPLIAVTGYGRDTDRVASAEAGFDAHLVKPVEPHQVDALIRSLRAPKA